ncbi:DNA adenine methylase, partial [Bacteroides fragilis]
MQYKCRPFFVFMGKTEEFCCPEIQTHILHDKMIMKKEKTYSRAPLPFVGQKRMFVSEFKKILKHFDDKTIFVDLFGGSGLLSHITKRERPDAVVIYNDHDNYRERLENIDRTNTLLRDLRKIVGIYPRHQKITGKMREAFLERIRLEETTGFVDYLTLSTSLLFSGKYAQNMEELE